MADRDPAFLWETEMLRNSEREQQGTRSGVTIDEADGWLTLREASEATGVPTETIRKWARNENIPSHLERSETGFLRVVSMDGIRRWADQIGRDIESPEPTGTIRSEPDRTAPKTVDLTDTSPTETTDVPEGSMLVPLDSWNRILNQLGNLHEAGQQLAEARERAAKAETESRFLKERLADLRQELERAREPAATVAGPETHPEAAKELDNDKSLVRRVYASWRRGRRAKR